MAEKPVITTTDAGGPLDVVADRRTGSSSSRASRPSRMPVRTCSGTRTRPGVGQGPRGRRAAVLARDGRDAGGGRVEDGVLLADGAVAVGDRGLPALLLPALAARTGIEVVRQGSAQAAARHRPRALPRRQRPEAHGWILEALRAHPGVAVLHEWVLHHLIAGLTLGRKDVAQYLAALERDHGIAGRLLGLGVVDGCVPPLWETRPEDFPLAGVVLDATRGRGVIVHSQLRRGARPSGGTEARVADPAPGLARAGGRSRRPRRRPGDRLPRAPEREQADPAAARGVRACTPLRRRRGCSSSAPPRRSSTCRAGSRGWASLRGDRARGVRRGAAVLVADGRRRRRRLAAGADDGRDVRQRDPRPLARPAARRLGPGWFAESRTRLP